MLADEFVIGPLHFNEEGISGESERSGTKSVEREPLSDLQFIVNTDEIPGAVRLAGGFKPVSELVTSNEIPVVLFLITYPHTWFDIDFDSNPFNLACGH